MPLRRKVLFGLLGLAVGALLVVGLEGYRNYRAACVAADRYLASATDGPWVRSKVGFVFDFDGSESAGALAPHWVFRFRNPRNGNESKRIYVSASGERAFSYNVLDPLPVLGFRR